METIKPQDPNDNHHAKRFAPVILALAAMLTACGQVSDVSQNKTSDHEESNYKYDPSNPDYTLPEGTSVSDFHFKKGATSVAGLTRKVHKKSIKVCYLDSSNSEARKDIVRKSIFKWIDAIKSVTNKPVAKQVEFLSWNATGCDVYFNIGQYSPATTNMGAVPRLNIASSGWFGSETVILHEFGHAFGLLDTYNGTGGSCQTGQPASVMCYAKYTELMQDDILGVRSVYQDVKPTQ